MLPAAPGTPALHWGFGVPAYRVDANGHRTDYRYDRHGRLTAVIRPGDTEELPTTVHAYRAADPHRGLAYAYDRSGGVTMESVPMSAAANAVRTDQGQLAGAPAVSSQITYRTGKAQDVLVLERDEDGLFSASMAMRYGARGTPIFQAEPYRQHGEAFRVVPIGSPGTDLGRDPLDRIVVRRLPPETAAPDAPRVETWVHFLPLQEREFDAEDLSSQVARQDHTGTPTIRSYDSFGRLASVAETVRTTGGTETWLTRYGHDARDRIVWVLDS